MSTIIVTTERGRFEVSAHNVLDDEKEALRKLLKQAVAGETTNMSLTTSTGYIVFGKELMKTAVIEMVE